MALHVAGDIGRPVADLSGVAGGDGAAVDLGVTATDLVPGRADTGAGVAGGQGDLDRAVGPAARVGGGGGGRRLGVDVDVAGVGVFDVPGDVGRPIGDHVARVAADRYGRARVLRARPAVDGVVRGGQAGVAGVGRREGEARGRGVPPRRRRAGQAGRDRDGLDEVDVHEAVVGRLDVAGVIDRPVGDRMAAGRRDGEGGRVGLRRAAVDGVVGGGDAGERVGRPQGDRLAPVGPTRRGAGREAGRRGGGRREVDVDERVVRRLGVAGVVDRPVADRVAARGRDGDGGGVGLTLATVDGVVGRRDAGQGVGRRQGERRGRLVPAGGGAGRQAARRGDGRREVDVDVAAVSRLGVAGVVDRPVADRVAAGGQVGDRGGRVGLRRAAVDGVVGGRDAGQRVGSAEGHRRGVRPTGAGAGDQPRGGGDRRRGVDVHGVGGGRAAHAERIDGAHVQVPGAFGLACELGGRLGREVGAAQQHADGAAAVVADGDVAVAVVVEVAERHPEGAVADRQVDLGLQGAVAVAVQHADAVGGVVHGNQVDRAVVVHVGRRERVGARTGRVVDVGGEGAVALVQQHACGADVVRRGDVGMAVAVQVGQHDGLGSRAAGVADRGLEGAVAVAHQHADAAGVDVGRDHILLAVTVQVADGDRCGVRVGAERRRRAEGAVALVEQHAQVAGAGVGGDHVELAVAVEVAEAHALGRGARAGRVVDVRLEGAVAVTEQHADRVRRLVADDEVELAVAVDVADGERPGVGAGGVVDGRLEGAVAVTEQHADGVGRRILDDEVGLAVAVQVGDAVLGRGRADGVVDLRQVRQRGGAGRRHRDGAGALIEHERVAGDSAAALGRRRPGERGVRRGVPGRLRGVCRRTDGDRPRSSRERDARANGKHSHHHCRDDRESHASRQFLGLCHLYLRVVQG